MRPYQIAPGTRTQPVQRTRLLDVHNLDTGAAVFLMAQYQNEFEERVRFGPRTQALPPQSPAAWVANMLNEVAEQAHAESPVRPILVPLPVAALMDENLCTVCHAVIENTPLCAQEISLEIDDASVTLLGSTLYPTLEQLKRIGFRLSLNASRSWSAPLNDTLRILLDTLRMDARFLEPDEELQKRVETAHAAGLTIIADRAFWRDGPYLSRHGIDYAVQPRCDS